MTFKFLDRFSTLTHVHRFMKFIQWEPSCSMLREGRTDIQTDMRANAILQTWLKLTLECLMIMITSWLEVYYCVKCLVFSGERVVFESI